MELRMKDQDYAVENGGTVSLTGTEELLARALFRLTVRRGSFPFLPELGSRMYLLRRAKPGQWESLARQYAAEALADEPELAVTGALVRADGERLWVDVQLYSDGQTLTASAEL